MIRKLCSLSFHNAFVSGLFLFVTTSNVLANWRNHHQSILTQRPTERWPREQAGALACSKGIRLATKENRKRLRLMGETAMLSTRFVLKVAQTILNDTRTRRTPIWLIHGSRQVAFSQMAQMSTRARQRRLHSPVPRVVPPIQRDQATGLSSRQR